MGHVLRVWFEGMPAAIGWPGGGTLPYRGTFRSRGISILTRVIPIEVVFISDYSHYRYVLSLMFYFVDWSITLLWDYSPSIVPTAATQDCMTTLGLCSVASRSAHHCPIMSCLCHIRYLTLTISHHHYLQLPQVTATSRSRPAATPHG